jgi:hypothetical protein
MELLYSIIGHLWKSDFDYITFDEKGNDSNKEIVILMK